MDLWEILLSAWKKKAKGKLITCCYPIMFYILSERLLRNCPGLIRKAKNFITTLLFLCGHFPYITFEIRPLFLHTQSRERALKLMAHVVLFPRPWLQSCLMHKISTNYGISAAVLMRHKVLEVLKAMLKTKIRLRISGICWRYKEMDRGRGILYWPGGFVYHLIK